MSPEIVLLLAVVLAYLIGSIPFGYLIARILHGVDIRQHGSGNIGATNVGRVLGTKWGFLALAFDLTKGLVPAWALPLWMLPSDWRIVGAVLCGVGTIIGHMYPLWLGLRGGKGVATALGVAIILSPWSAIAAGAVFLFSFALFRFVSLSSMLAAVIYTITHFLLTGSTVWSTTILPLTLFSLTIPALIILRHRANLGRLWQGTEPRYTFSRPQSPTPVPPSA